MPDWFDGNARWRESACKPGSVYRQSFIWDARHRTPQATYPDPVRTTPCGSLFGLAPGGVYPATTVASGAVRSYRTISPLPVPCDSRRYLFCGTRRRLKSPRCYLAPCPVEPGLSSMAAQALPQRLSSQLPPFGDCRHIPG